MISIDIISDTVCPWCFIGKKRLEKAIKKSNNLNFSINWHSFQLNPEMPTQGMDRKVYLLKKFGSTSKADGLYSNIKKSGIRYIAITNHDRELFNVNVNIDINKPGGFYPNNMFLEPLNFTNPIEDVSDLIKNKKLEKVYGNLIIFDIQNQEI